MQLISHLPLPPFLPAILWQVHTLPVSIFLPNTIIHQLLSEWTQPPEKPPPTQSSLRTSFKSTWKANSGLLADEKQRHPQFWVPPHAVGRQHGAHGSPALAFPTQMPLLCSAISKCTCGSPAPPSSAQGSVLPCARLLERLRRKVKGRGRDEAEGQFFFQIPFTPVQLPSYRSLWTMGLAQPHYS